MLTKYTLSNNEQLSNADESKFYIPRPDFCYVLWTYVPTCYSILSLTFLFIST